MRFPVTVWEKLVSVLASSRKGFYFRLTLLRALS